jgi:hypothetical protein
MLLLRIILYEHGSVDASPIVNTRRPHKCKLYILISCTISVGLQQKRSLGEEVECARGFLGQRLHLGLVWM